MPFLPKPEDSMTPLLEARRLVKHYRAVKAVNGVSFSIPKGICFGLLGPNGAGKTTTVEMIEGILPPTSGETLYLGSPIDERFRNDAGIMFQSTALQDYIRVNEALRLFQSFYRRTRPLDELIERCALGDFLDRDVQRLSGGQRQRLLLAIALVNGPQVLVRQQARTGFVPARFQVILVSVPKVAVLFPGLSLGNPHTCPAGFLPGYRAGLGFPGSWTAIDFAVQILYHRVADLYLFFQPLYVFFQGL